MPQAYPKECTEDVVRVARTSGTPIRQVAADFGIAESCLRRMSETGFIRAIPSLDEIGSRIDTEPLYEGCPSLSRPGSPRVLHRFDVASVARKEFERPPSAFPLRYCAMGHYSCRVPTGLAQVDICAGRGGRWPDSPDRHDPTPQSTPAGRSESGATRADDTPQAAPLLRYCGRLHFWLFPLWHSQSCSDVPLL